MTANRDQFSVMEPYELFRWGEDLFAHRDYVAAAEVLGHLVARFPDERDLPAARELLARAYYHSAQLDKAIETATQVLAREPDNGYAALVLARSHDRASHPDEAAAAHRLAEALGSGFTRPTTDAD